MPASADGGVGRRPGLWIAVAAAATFGFVLPYLHLASRLWLERNFRVIQLLALSALVAWFLIRPIAVLIADRRRGPTPPPPPSAGVSVVIPCHNAADRLPGTVRALLSQTIRSIEIVLVENGSTDETRNIIQELERLHPEVRGYSVVPHPGEYAASVAINHGVSRASYDYVLRLDDDTDLRRDAVAAAVAQLTATGAVAVACDLRLANPSATVWTRLQAVEYLLAMDMDRRSQAIVNSIVCCSGGMSLFRRDLILAAGGFVSAPPQVSEDMDMTLKAHRFGDVSIAPEAIGFTEVPATLRELVRQRFRWAISGTVALYLHRQGLANRSYWYDGRVGFIGLPIRALIALRDLLAPIYLLDVFMLLAHDGPVWFVLLLGARTAIMGLQFLALMPALNRKESRQGLEDCWLVPFFLLVYGPILLATRFAGSWAGVRHVIALRRQHDQVMQRGLSVSAAG